jgi:hypothetical protein
MNVDQVIQFFQSWGLDVDDDAASVSAPVYVKLVNEAKRMGGRKLASFCVDIIDATDDEFYLSVDSWDKLSEQWSKA